MSRISAFRGLVSNLFKKPATIAEGYSFVPDTFRWMPRRDEEKCTGCGACYERCSSGATKIRDEGEARTITVDAYNCIFCGRCADACPEHALSLNFEPKTPEERAAREEKLKAAGLADADVCLYPDPDPRRCVEMVSMARYGHDPAPTTDTTLKLQRCTVCGEIMPVTEKYLNVVRGRTLANLQPETAKVIEKDMEKYLTACISCRQKYSQIWGTHPRKWVE